MLSSITTSHRPTADRAFLLAKHHDRCQSFLLAYGSAHVSSPRADEDACTVCLFVAIDSVELARNRRENQGEGSGPTGVDASHLTQNAAGRCLQLERLPDRPCQRIRFSR